MEDASQGRKLGLDEHEYRRDLVGLSGIHRRDRHFDPGFFPGGKLLGGCLGRFAAAVGQHQARGALLNQPTGQFQADGAGSAGNQISGVGAD